MAIISQNRTLLPFCNPSPSTFKLPNIHKHPLFKLSPHLHNMNSNPTLVNSRLTTVSASSLTPKTAAVDGALQFQQDGTVFTSTADSTQWSEFAKNVSGEWDGYGADFSTEGKPFELPENVVPEAYREWEVKVFDWQTQCPTLAEPDDFIAKYKLIKLLPTVGCEADAATRHTIEERNIGSGDSNVSAFAYQSSGCYVAVWPKENLGVHNRILELEHCLVDPQNRESRVRVIQIVRVENRKLVLQGIKVFAEQWYGPFRNGEQLGGCAIRDSTFAATEALKIPEISGFWKVVNAVASFQHSKNKILQQHLDDKVQNYVRDEGGLVMLPKKLWCSIKESENGETCCEVGWLLDQGSAITSKCIFLSDAELKEIATARETFVASQ